MSTKMHDDAVSAVAVEIAHSLLPGEDGALHFDAPAIVQAVLDAIGYDALVQDRDSEYSMRHILQSECDALVAERDRLREALRIIERSIAGDAQGLQRIARGALGEEEPKRHFQVGFKGGPWDGQFYEVEHIMGPVFAVGHLVGNHYWFDSNSGNKPTYHWDGTEWAVKDGIHPQDGDG